MKLHVPEQHIELQPQEQPGYWMGEITIAGKQYRVEAYDEDSPDETVEQLITEPHILAECGDALGVTTLPNDAVVYLVVMPRGD